MNHDLIIRHVSGYGYLPIIKDYETDKELYRGEFKEHTLQALNALIKQSNKIKG